MYTTNNEIIKPATVAQIVKAYNLAITEVEQSYRQLESASQRLQNAMPDSENRYSTSFYTLPRSVYNYDETIKSVLLELKRKTWQYLIDLTGVYQMLSVKLLAALDENLEQGKMPEITEQAIFDMLATIQDNGTDIIKECIEEAYSILRPRYSNLKTNQKEAIANKVILTNVVDHKPFGGFRVNHWRQQNITVIDRAFHLLDKKQLARSYHSPLSDAIANCENQKGETSYFEFKVFHNGNLHLKYKRPDLVDKFNQIAGASILPKGGVA